MKKNLKTAVVSKVIDDSTIVVKHEFKVAHKLIDRYVLRSSKLLLDSKNHDVNVGDNVTYVQCKPISKNKSNRVVNVISTNLKSWFKKKHV